MLNDSPAARSANHIAPGFRSSTAPFGSASHAARLPMHVLFIIHCLLRIGGLGWNIEHHTAFSRPPETVPTYHVDEALLVESMRTDFRLFSSYALVADGPLTANLIYVPLAAAGERPPLHWRPAHALVTGRLVAAISACLAFPVLWLLLAELGVGKGMSLLALAVLTFAPNEVFNAHFARSHTLANLLQLVVLLATAKLLAESTRRNRCTWFAIATFAAIMAGSARYPFLTLGLFPAAGAIVLFVRSARSGQLFQETAALGLAGGAALLVGLLFGFDLRPAEILRKGFAAQAAVGQFPWADLHGIAISARAKFLSVFDFPGGTVRWVLALAAPFAVLGRWPADKGDRSRWMAALVLAWAALYLALWAKFSVPWQRYSIPLSTALLVCGAMGLDRVAAWTARRLDRGQLRVATSVAAALLLAPAAFFCALMLHRFMADTTNPLYELSIALRDEPKRQIFVHGFWQWNKPLLDVMPPDRFTLRFVPSMQDACAVANEGDLLVNFVFEPLRGSCVRHGLTPVFHASNLGWPGFPYSREHDTAPWSRRHYEDYHYLFEEVTVFRFVASHDR